MTTILSLKGLRPDQVSRLTSLRDEMLGWQFVGCAVDIDGDYYWSRGDRVRSIDEAEVFTDAKAAHVAIKHCIRCGPHDGRELTVVGVYRKADGWELGPCQPNENPS